VGILAVVADVIGDNTRDGLDTFAGRAFVLRFGRDVFWPKNASAPHRSKSSSTTARSWSSPGSSKAHAGGRLGCRYHRHAAGSFLIFNAAGYSTRRELRCGSARG